MKISLSILFFFVYSSVFSQTINNIDTLVQQIEKARYTDSIIIIHNPQNSKYPCQITGFFFGDTLMKTIALFKTSQRKRVTYYNCTNDLMTDRPRFVTEYDSVENIQLSKVCGFDNYIDNYTVLSSYIKNPLDSVYFKYPSRLMTDADYSIEMALAVIDKKAKKYHFKVRLTKALPLPPGCGIIAFALLQKFEVLSTNFPNYNKKFVLLIEPCPEFLGNGFFQTGKIYEVDVATNSGTPSGFSYSNDYKKEQLPIFWNRKIIKEN